jgi:hypothetical protein
MKTNILYPALAVAILLASLLTSCAGLKLALQNPNYIYEDGAVLVRGNESPVELKNNSAAVDPSFSALAAFIRQDSTDMIPYVAKGSPSGLTPFVCADFAETLHNSAEAAGLRAAYVGIDFAGESTGHAINAFQTTDQGLVFIDCTGPSLYSQLEGGSTADSWDKVAYVLIGQEYGIIPLDKAHSADYSYYLQYKADWQQLKDLLAAYNSDVKSYNQEIDGKVYRPGSVEMAAVRSWERRLIDQEKTINDLKARLGDSFFKPLGQISNYFIHW